MLADEKVVVGLPPAWRAMHLKVVDALAGR
jgi:hypothetical protein